MDLEFRVDIEDGSGNKLGSGPLASVGRWQYTARLDRAGTIAFDYAANDPQADIVTNRRVARAHALLNGAWVEVGAGVIDNIETSPGNDGRVSLNASGLDLLRELAYRTVGTLEVGSGSGATHSAALTAIGALAPDGWTFTPASAPDNDYIYARFGGESVLGALVQLADKTQTHFYRSTNRTLVFVSDFEDSGVRAIQARGYLRPETAAIVSLRRTVDTNDLLTRIHPYGSGQGAARLTLAATTRTAPAGYYLNKTLNYIENATASSEYGLVDYPEIEFKEIGPISNTDADLQAAANMLFDAALEELRRRSTLPDQETYTLTIAGCSELLRPMQTIRLVYRDTAQGIDIDEDLYILEATWEVDESGIRTSQLVVSTQDRWPDSDESAAAERAVQGRVFTAHPQLNANSYVVAYNKNVDADNSAAFRFRFGSEVVNLQQVLFEFQLLPFEATVRAVGGATSGSGELSTTVPSTNTSGNPSNDTSGVPSTNTSGAPSSNTSGAPSNNTSGTPSVSNTGAATGNTGVAAGNTGTASGNTGTASGDTGTPSTSNTGTPSVDDTGGAEGAEIDASGFHNHAVNVIAGAGSLGNVTLHESGGLFFLANAFVTGSEPIGVTPGGAHTHDMSDHTHSLGGHTHSLNSHTHSLNSHTHSLNSHTHDLGSHTHTLGNHTHTLNNHTHDLGNHTHTLGNHTHDLGNHTHSLSNHVHDLSEALSPQYGIFREDADLTYGVDGLEYRVNGGAWADLNTATDAGSNWYALDITADVYDSATFRPLQTSNTLEIQVKTTTIAIDGWQIVIATNTLVVTTVVHDLPNALVGKQVRIDGAALGNNLSTDIDGLWTVDTVGANSLVLVNGTTLPDDNAVFSVGGTITPLLTATIDAQLSVRNTIQAIAYL